MFELPEEDADFLNSKGIKYALESGPAPGGGLVVNGIVFPEFAVPANLMGVDPNGSLVRCQTCELMVIVPSGYATTPLDSFHTRPVFKRVDGALPQNATANVPYFNREWQFWSRHLGQGDWRPGVDSFETYLQYIVTALKEA